MRRIGPVLRLLQSRRGNVSILFALASPLVIGAAALGAETSYWYYKQHKLQAAADNGAYAAALEIKAGSSSAVINNAALYVASQNGFSSSGGSITVQTPPASGPHAGDSSSVSVLLTQNQERFFTALFSSSPVPINATATAQTQQSYNACILALDPSASQAAYFNGSASLTLNGCIVMANSTASDGVYVWGASSVTADCVASGGGVANHGGLSETVCPAPITNTPPAPDPYASLAAPPVSGTCASSSGSTLSPGTYCGGLTIHGNVTLQPGVYVIKGGTLKANGNGSLSGSGVTIYLTQGATVQMNGNIDVNLSAPTSGAYSGVLFFGDRANSGLTQTFNGTASSVMTGALYFPTQAVSYKGNFSGTNGCTQIVADTVAWSGNTTFKVNCSAYGMKTIPAIQTVKLVG